MRTTTLAGVLLAMLLPLPTTASTASAAVAETEGSASRLAAKPPCTNIAHRGMWQRTEEQVEGATRNARWGFVEIDARMTSDGQVVALHDPTMTRPSGGASTADVGSLSMSEIRALPFLLGDRVERTRSLIRVAADENVPIMVTISSYSRYREQWQDGGLAALWEAAQLHPKPAKVYFGGSGGEQAMQEAFPEASTFHRYADGADVVGLATGAGVDLAGLPRPMFSRDLVRDLRYAGVRVATNQLATEGAVDDALSAGIRLVQTDRSRRTVLRWCS